MPVKCPAKDLDEKLSAQIIITSTLSAKEK